MNLYNFSSGLSYVSVGSVLIPVAAYFLAGKRNQLRKLVLILLLTSLLSEVANDIYVRLGNRGHLILNIFFVSQIMLLCLVYAKMISNKKIVKIALLTFPVISLACVTFLQPPTEYQSSIRVIGALLMISFAIRYFWQMYCYLPADDLSKFLKGWINIAVFSYFSFNLFLFICANYVFQNENNIVAMAFWSFHNLNNIVKNGLLGCGLYLSTEEFPKDPNDQ